MSPSASMRERFNGLVILLRSMEWSPYSVRRLGAGRRPQKSPGDGTMARRENSREADSVGRPPHATNVFFIPFSSEGMQSVVMHAYQFRLAPITPREQSARGNTTGEDRRAFRRILGRIGGP